MGVGLVIKIRNHVEHCYSNEEGKIIKDVISPYLRNEEKVKISFDGVRGVTSSFVNTAFIELMDEFEFESIKNTLQFIDTTSQINKMIKDRFSFEVKKRKDLVNA